MTILLVDDEPVALRLLQLTLQRQDFTVETATSARDALSWLEEVHPVELVITDQNMPGMTGLELLSVMRQDPRWRNLPVILCTAAADRATVEEALRSGLRHYVVKPVKPAQILEKVTRAIAEVPPALPSLSEGMTRLGLPEMGYKTLLRTSRQRLSALAMKLAASRAIRDTEEARQIARRVLEPAQLLGASRAISAVAELEAASSQQEIERSLHLVSQELASLDEALAVALRPPRLAPIPDPTFRNSLSSS